ncbi:ABC transporter ATP-binding protein [Microbacterium soli]
MNKITIDRLVKRFGDVTALEDTSFTVAPAEVVCLLGPSGCGKSTVLNILAGFIDKTSGSVLVDGEEVRDIGPSRSVVFQSAALFPWMTVWDNATVGPRTRRLPYRERAEELLAAVGLSGFEKRYPYELSGGMQQRVSIARALLNEPDVLLMDEPFGALDSQTRLAMQELLMEISAKFRPTVIFVTHDVDEALYLGDRILLMSPRPGRVAREITVTTAKPRGYGFFTADEFTGLKQEILEFAHNGWGVHDD